MLNYLGEGTGAGTMPSAVPGGQLGAALPAAPPPIAQPAQPAGPPGGIQGMGLLPPGTEDSQSQYAAVTQEDGTILLHLRKPDGGLGPVVKVINAIKPQKQA